MTTKNFQELIVWKKTHKFVIEVYKMTKDFPDEEKFGLVSQFRRSAVSIPANIVEGYKKRGKSDKVRYFNIAHASLEESIYYLILSKDLGYGYFIELFDLADEIGKLINAYSKSILSSS